MKRIVFLITIAVSLLALFGCNIFATEHTHEFGEWIIVKEATCTEDGSRVRSCSCGEIENEVVSATGHTEETVDGKPATCTKSGLKDGKVCYACGEIIVAQKNITALNHNYKYTEETDENGNTVTMFVCQREKCEKIATSTAGLYDDENNFITSWADLVNDYGLNELSDLNNVLKENESLTSGITLFIDDSISDLDIATFKYCSNITKIIIPSSVTSIINTSIESCAYLKNITVDENNEYYKSIDGNLYDKEGITLIRYASGKEDKKFDIPDGVEKIEMGAMMYSPYLEKLYIPDSVTLIGRNAFSYCDSLANVYFAGTAEQWAEIEKKVSTELWMSSNTIIHYDGKIKFAGDWFLQTQGSASSRLIVVVNNDEFYANDILYDKLSCIDTLKIKNSERLLTMFEGSDEEKSNILKKILANEKWYITEEKYRAIAICNIDDIYYFLTLWIDQDSGMYSVYTVHYAELNLER